MENQTDNCMWNLMDECYELACDLAYKGIIARDKPDHISEENWDHVWGWVDGLPQVRIINQLEGKCSFKDFISFSVQKTEEELRETIKLFKTLKEKANEGNCKIELDSDSFLLKVSYMDSNDEWFTEGEIKSYYSTYRVIKEAFKEIEEIVSKAIDKAEI